MICKPCRRGAEAAQIAAEEEREDIRMALLARAKLRHDECPGDTWCDCQHKPPQKGTSGRA